jgi:DNA-binding transcriptional regulator GbsR (MarR family)
LILEGKIDPEEWKREIDRVYSDLDLIEKEIELSKMRGKNDLNEDFEECRRHIELIIELC